MGRVAPGVYELLRDTPPAGAAALTTRKKAASGRFCTSPSENNGITDTKAFITARISISMTCRAPDQ
jgi:hypothetical protein